MQKMPNEKWVEYFDYYVKILYATMHNKNTSSNNTYRKGKFEECIQTVMVLTIVVTCNSTNKSFQLKQCIKLMSFAIVAYKSWHL